MLTRSRWAAAATLLAGLWAHGQDRATLPPTQLQLPAFQPYYPNVAPASGVQSTNPLLRQQAAPQYTLVGGRLQPTLGPEPRVVPMPGGPRPPMMPMLPLPPAAGTQTQPMMPMMPPMLGPAPMGMQPMPPLPTVPNLPMFPDTPMTPMPTTPMSSMPMSAVPHAVPHASTTPTTPEYTVLPQTTLGVPTEPPHTMAQPSEGFPASYAVPSEQGTLPEYGHAAPGYGKRCFWNHCGLFTHLCWTPAPATCWVDAEYLTWWMKGTTLPALVTRGDPADAIPGALGQPGTSVLFGGNVSDEIQSGIRLTAGSRFGNTRYGWEVRGFVMDEQETNFNVGTSADFPVLARPFFDPVANTPSSLLVGSPGAFAGNVNASLKTTWWGAEANFTNNINCVLVDHLFVGFRYMELTDRLKMTTHYSVLPGGVAFINGTGVTPGSFGTIEDSVRARNQFYGGQIGIRERFSVGRFMLDLRGSVAVGSGLQQVDIRGASAVADVTARTTGNGGLIGQPSNIGRFDKNDLTVIPEASARLQFALTQSISVFAGYDFLYWANVVRAGDQIDPRMDSRQVPISPLFTGERGTNPLVGPRSTSFLAHGVTFGISLRY